jgi:hypothetical protein
LGWKEQIRKIQKPAFSRVAGINKDFHISEDSSPLDIFEIFFSTELLKGIQSETNRYATQQIKKNKQEGPLKPKSVFSQWNPVTLQEIKKFFATVIHMSVLRKSSLRDTGVCVQLFRPHMQLRLECLVIGSSRYCQCYI